MLCTMDLAGTAKKLRRWLLLVLAIVSMAFGDIFEDCILNSSDWSSNYAVIAQRSPRYCPPGHLIVNENSDDCTEVKQFSTMPFWNRCRFAWECSKLDTCEGDFLEVDKPCTATQWPTCRSTIQGSESPIHGITCFPQNCTEIQPGATTDAMQTVSNTVDPNSCSDFTDRRLLLLCGLLSFVSGVTFVVIVIILCRIPKQCRSPYFLHFPWYLPASDKVKKVTVSKYRMKGNPAGTGVLIVNSGRKYIEPDKALSKEIFKLLLGSNTECEVIEATSLREVETKFKAICAKSDLGDCFACIVVGHGNCEETTDGLICKDQSYLRMDTLQSWLYRSNCPQLNGKPKIIFDVCCRGEASEEPVLVQGSGGGGVNPPQIPQLTSETADMLTCYASANHRILNEEGVVVSEGKVAYFNKDGSVYLLALRDKMKEFGATEDLLSVLTEVSKCIRSNISTFETSGELVKQHPVFQSYLAAKIPLKHFFPDSEEEAAGPSDSPGPSSTSGYASVPDSEAPNTTSEGDGDGTGSAHSNQPGEGATACSSTSPV